MRVVIPISDDPWHPRAGGIVAYSMGLATYLSGRGVDVELLTVGERRPSAPITTTPVANRVRGEFGFAMALRSYGKSRRWDADTTVVANTELYAWAFRSVYPPPRIALVAHGPTFPTLVSRRPLAAVVFRAFIERRTMSFTYIIIAIDREAEAYFAQRYPAAEVCRIPIGVDTEHFRPLDRMPARHRWSLDKEVALLWVGRFAPEKNPWLAAAAFEKISERNPSAVLLVAGAGSESAPFHRVRAKVGDRLVRFLGHVNRADLPTLYSAADGLLLTSSVEQFPTVVVESLACGTPVFATSVGDVPLILDMRSSGEICRPTPSAFAEKVLDRLPETTEVRESNLVVRRKTAERYSWNRIGPTILSALQGKLSR